VYANSSLEREDLHCACCYDSRGVGMKAQWRSCRVLTGFWTYDRKIELTRCPGGRHTYQVSDLVILFGYLRFQIPLQEG
jgi:hypothetical protein